MIGKRQQWDGIGGYCTEPRCGCEWNPAYKPPAGGGESEAPAASRDTNLAAVKRILDHSIDTYLDCGWESNYDAAYQVRILDHSIDTYPDCDWESNYDAAYQGWLTNTAAEILNALQKENGPGVRRGQNTTGGICHVPTRFYRITTEDRD